MVVALEGAATAVHEMGARAGEQNGRRRVPEDPVRVVLLEMERAKEKAEGRH